MWYKKVQNWIDIFLTIAIFGLNLLLFKFESYAVFRDYTIVKEQDFTSNTLNPIFVLAELGQQKLTDFFSLSQISSFYFAFIFSLGFGLTYFSLWKSIQLWTPMIIQIGQLYVLKLSTFLISCLFVYSPFFLERFFMGQDRIILGYFFILPFTYLLTRLFPQAQNISASKNAVGLVIIGLILSFINLHALVLCFIISLCTLPIYSKTFKTWPILELILVGQIIISLILNFGLFDPHSTDYYFKQIAHDQIKTEQIIQIFSPKILPGQNLYLRVLVGSASWNTPGFIDMDRIIFGLAEWADWTVYNNRFWAIVYLCWFLLGWVGFLYLTIYKSKHWQVSSKSKLIRYIPLFGLPIIALIFSFGLSDSLFYNLNRLIFYLPGSYIFREAGKAYVLFLAASCLILALFLARISMVKQYWLQFILFLTFIATLLPFFQISSALNYVSLPAIFDKSLSICRQNKQTLAIAPSKLYVLPSYSPVFLVNYFESVKAGSCNIIRPQTVELAYTTTKGQKSNIEIGNVELSDQVNRAIELYQFRLPKIVDGTLRVDFKIQQEVTKKLIDDLKSLDIDLLLLDSRAYDYGLTLKEDLSNQSSVLSSENGYTLFRI